MAAQTPRPYQQDGIDRVMQAFARVRQVLLVLPTAGGKTTIFGLIGSGLANGKRRVLVLVHRKELAYQAANRFKEFGVDYGLIMAGEPRKPYAPVQIATVQTLIRRKCPPADLVICDEAHLSTAKTWSTILAAYPQAKILGCTATPWRLGGAPLHGTYGEIVVVATPDDLRSQGFLCAYNGFSYKAPDVSKLKTVAGEYNEKQSSDAMREPTLVANIVEQWQAHASHLSTVVFAVTVEHSQELTAQFKAAGVSAEHLDGETASEQRKAILARVASGQTRVLCNVGVAVEGLDIPRLKCCILARPTKSLARAIQMMGRVRRPYEGQTARIHDHAFNIRLHGLPDDPRDYSLNAIESAPPSMTQCQECLAMYRGRACTACAHENEPKILGERELVTVDDAEIFEFSSGTATPIPDTRRPVDVTWTIGKVIDGIFEGTVTEETQWGSRKRHLVRGEKRRYSMPGGVILDKLMAKVKQGRRVVVRHTAETPLPLGRRRKEFSVEADEPDAEEESRRLTQLVVSLYVNEGLSTRDVAIKVGIGKETARKILAAAGVSRRPKSTLKDAEKVSEAIRLYTVEKLGCPAIAKRLSVSKSRVNDWLKENGVARRSRQENAAVRAGLSTCQNPKCAKTFEGRRALQLCCSQSCSKAHWRIQNVDAQRAMSCAWRKNNPEKSRALKQEWRRKLYENDSAQEAAHVQ